MLWISNFQNKNKLQNPTLCTVQHALNQFFSNVKRYLKATLVNQPASHVSRESTQIYD